MTFNEYAKAWDNERRIKRASIIADEIKEFVGLSTDMNCLEFGCGTGLIGFNLKDDVNHIDMMDISEKMIEVLEQKIELTKAKNITAIHHNIYDGILDKKYDLIFSSMVFHHISDLESLLERLTGMLKTGGRLCIVDLVSVSPVFHSEESDFDGHHGFDLEELSDLLSKSGLINSNFKTFYSGVKVVEGVDVNYSLFILEGEYSV